MKLRLIGSDELLRAAAELSGKFGFELSDGGIPVTLEEGCGEFTISRSGGKVAIRAQKRVQIFYALKRVSDEYASLPEGGTLCPRPAFDDLCYMFDLSRNAVPKRETLFELIRHLAVLGYDTLGLYMEDTFVVKNQPYFGYLRTPLTGGDIREADEYCRLFGIELVPYIQTLAHFNSLVRHYAYEWLFDVNDIVLVGEERTYEFIEDLISACSEYFSSRRIHLGMDEAYMLGRGKYMDKHGARTRFEIMEEHLKRVNAICNKYGLSPMIWSDMFFSLTMSAQYANDLPEEVVSLVPENIELVYWDYGNLDENHYAKMLDNHLKFRNPIGFAGGAWKWVGYTPDNRFSFATCGASMRACIRKGIKHYTVTGWGDNGAECSVFATLPALLFCSRMNYGQEERDAAFEDGFESLTGVPLPIFFNLDLCNRVTDHNDVRELNSANKYLLFNDILLGTLDTTIARGTDELYRKHTAQLAASINRAGKWRYLFETQYRLSRVLALKSELGIKMRAAYRS
ncbi:MAG: beta-N-acetylhexosaminidase [Clostridia bacterium]|nr:beta-N-acetylhexosaminidase [Clostridia bacterium]